MLEDAHRLIQEWSPRAAQAFVPARESDVLRLVERCGQPSAELISSWRTWGRTVDCHWFAGDAATDVPSLLGWYDDLDEALADGDRASLLPPGSSLVACGGLHPSWLVVLGDGAVVAPALEYSGEVGGPVEPWADSFPALLYESAYRCFVIRHPDHHSVSLGPVGRGMMPNALARLRTMGAVLTNELPDGSAFLHLPRPAGDLYLELSAATGLVLLAGRRRRHVEELEHILSELVAGTGPAPRRTELAAWRLPGP